MWSLREFQLLLMQSCLVLALNLCQNCIWDSYKERVKLFNYFNLFPCYSSLVQWNIPQAPARALHASGGSLYWSDGVLHCPVCPSWLWARDLAVSQVRPLGLGAFMCTTDMMTESVVLQHGFIQLDLFNYKASLLFCPPPPPPHMTPKHFHLKKH